MKTLSFALVASLLSIFPASADTKYFDLGTDHPRVVTITEDGNAYAEAVRRAGAGCGFNHRRPACVSANLQKIGVPSNIMTWTATCSTRQMFISNVESSALFGISATQSGGLQVFDETNNRWLKPSEDMYEGVLGTFYDLCKHSGALDEN